MYYVYVLRSLKTGYRYIGCTRDIETRLRQHNEGLTKGNRMHRPFELIYQEKFSTLLLARRRERFFKSGKGREYLKALGY